MEIICLLLCTLSLTTARVYPRTEVNDVFSGVDGFIYDVPVYEDPEVTFFKLTARGIMPVYMAGDNVKDSKDSADKDDKLHYQTDDIKKGLDSVIAQLQEVKNKLENGNEGIYLDIDKTVLYLENLKHQLYLDLHTTDISTKQPTTPHTITEKSYDKSSTDEYSMLKEKLSKKYFSSGDPILKYLSLYASGDELLSSDYYTESSFKPVTPLLPYSTPIIIVKESDDAHTEHSIEFNISKDENLPSDTEQLSNLSTTTKLLLTLDATTEDPLVLDKEVFKYQLLRKELPPVEAVPEETIMKTYRAGDIVSSTEAKQVDKEDKTIFPKKWTGKLSSTR